MRTSRIEGHTKRSVAKTTPQVDIDSILKILKKEYENWDTPSVTLIATHHGTPFKVLVATIISLRTKDQVTTPAATRLFALADTPKNMIKLTAEEISKAIYPCAFYANKAKQILEASHRILEECKGIVPSDIDVLCTFHGVGRKTANLVLSEGYGIPAMCVDTHVHRISNRFGYVKTTTAEKTEEALRKKLPLKYWNVYNQILVSFGQTICNPVSPKCSQCPVNTLCLKKGVTHSR